MRSAVHYLFFCNYCLFSAFNNALEKLPGNKPDSFPRQIIMASLMLAISSYFLAAGLLLTGLSFAGVPLVQSSALSVVVLISLLGTVIFTQYHFLSKNQGLLILSSYAGLVNQNKWIFPLTAILSFAFGFITFVVAAGTVLNL